MQIYRRGQQLLISSKSPLPVRPAQLEERGQVSVRPVLCFAPLFSHTARANGGYKSTTVMPQCSPETRPLVPQQTGGTSPDYGNVDPQFASIKSTSEENDVPKAVVLLPSGYIFRYVLGPALITNESVTATSLEDTGGPLGWIIDTKLNSPATQQWNSAINILYHGYIAVDVDAGVTTAITFEPYEARPTVFGNTVQIGPGSHLGMAELEGFVEYGPLPTQLRLG